MTGQHHFVLFFLIHVGIIAGLCRWQLCILKGRAGRLPIGADRKLMRQPGDSLRRKMTELNERLAGHFIALLAVPPVAGWLTLSIAAALPQTSAYGLTAAGTLFVVSVGICLQRMLRTVRLLRNCRLGLSGERHVADCLSDLAREGFTIFHDVPCQGANRMFNLDHVVVGNGGLAVIETKTRRKKLDDEGTRANPLLHDETALLWPRGFRDEDSMNQAVRNARWLAKHIKARLKIKTEPLPVLTLPGWWVDPAPTAVRERSAVAVVNPDMLHNTLCNEALGTLTDADITRIIDALDSMCRDGDFNDPV